MFVYILLKLYHRKRKIATPAHENDRRIKSGTFFDSTIYKISQHEKITARGFIAGVHISCYTVKIDPLPIGASLPKPEVKMEDISGSQVSLSDAKKENGLLVMFTHNYCPVVIRNRDQNNQAIRTLPLQIM